MVDCSKEPCLNVYFAYLQSHQKCSAACIKILLWLSIVLNLKWCQIQPKELNKFHHFILQSVRGTWCLFGSSVQSAGWRIRSVHTEFQPEQPADWSAGRLRWGSFVQIPDLGFEDWIVFEAHCEVYWNGHFNAIVALAGSGGLSPPNQAPVQPIGTDGFFPFSAADMPPPGPPGSGPPNPGTANVVVRELAGRGIPSAAALVPEEMGGMWGRTPSPVFPVL